MCRRDAHGFGWKRRPGRNGSQLRRCDDIATCWENGDSDVAQTHRSTCTNTRVSNLHAISLYRYIALWLGILLLIVPTGHATDDVLEVIPQELYANAFRPHLYGSEKSLESGRSIAVNSNGDIYIAGITRPKRNETHGWGSVEAGDECEGTDIFLAKISPGGRLLWVRRTGSTSKDVVNAMMITSNGIYLCGGTRGKMDPQANHYGKMDAFLIKYSSSGELQLPALQLGSDEDDECRDIAIDPVSGTVFMSGITSGEIQGVSQAGPHDRMKGMRRKTKRFIAKIQPEGGNTYNVVEVSQKRSVGRTAAEGIVVSKKHVVVVTNSRNPSTRFDEQANSVLELFHLSSIRGSPHQIVPVRITMDQGFYAESVHIVQESEEIASVYIAGLVYSKQDRNSSFGVVKFSIQEKAEMVWAKRVGSTTETQLEMFPTRRASLAVSNEKNLVYVGGLTNGMYPNFDANQTGIIETPIIALNATTGEEEYYIRSMVKYPNMIEEISDLIVDHTGAVRYVGTAYHGKYSISTRRGSTTSQTPYFPSSNASWSNESRKFNDSNALLGSYGSMVITSRRENEVVTSRSIEMNGTNLEDILPEAAKNNGASVAENERPLTGITAALVAVSAVGSVLLLGLVISHFGRSSGRVVHNDVEDIVAYELGVPTKKKKKKKSADTTPGASAGSGDEVRKPAGGSAGPE